MLLTAIAEPLTALTAVDRCDRCSAAALVRVTLKSGSELLFCGHHFDANVEAMTPVIQSIQDDRI